MKLTSITLISHISYLDFFEVEGHFAELTVQHSCFTFPFIMFFLLRTKDNVFAGLTLHLFIVTETFMLGLEIKERD